MSITAIAGMLVSPIAALLDKFIPDKDEAAKLAFEIATMAEKHAHAEILAQIEVNKAEAASPSIFVAGWRPAAGWVCVLAMANNFILIPYANASGYLSVPTLDLDQMMPVLLGMLGLAAGRSFEKAKGVARAK